MSFAPATATTDPDAPAAAAPPCKASLASLPVELQLQILTYAGSGVLSLRQVNKRFHAIVRSYERLIADLVFARSTCGRAAAHYGLPPDSYRKARNWRNNATFYKKFWRVFGDKKIYSDCWTSNLAFPFLDVDFFDTHVMPRPLELAYVFSRLDPVVEDDPKWFLASVRETSKY
ncbi:uncharacterized protein K452DRAFT_295508 [Aplosporella prunicola CBS 121167]|uniref:F-box domain-containing protein n=1 Tax=Aplosporella prunicola CBS 121167 TaxID=1176127 RepID=A0A6A6BLF2_9PEZI|nr:uncharacterized protein K452DRAFT_295508 [Aplosporella prunicola CBS 121167]KAF2144942.1 hypothetical protein K452DRAFT_295508 [Aplosporella prunicola CBS 121167]